MRRVLAYNIRRFRDDLDLKQEVLAARIGISTQQMSEIENGRRYVEDVCQLIAIAHQLGVSVNELIKPPLCLEVLPEAKSNSRRRKKTTV